MQGINLPAVMPQLTFTNLSVSGSNSIEHLEHQVAHLPEADADTLGLVVFTTGGNDLIHWYGERPPVEGAMYGATWEQAQPWVERFADRLDAMVTRVAESYPGGCHIFLANIYDPSDGNGDPAAAGLPPWPDLLRLHEAYNAEIAACADRHDFVHLVDIRGPLLGHGVHCLQWWYPHYHPDDPTYWYYWNLEDPNDRGYDAIRRQFLLAMIDVLAPEPAS